MTGAASASPGGASQGSLNRPWASAWLELLRISNAPTCISNALVGIAIGATALNSSRGVDGVDAAFAAWAPSILGAALITSVAILFLYSAGMILNDCFDRDIDARERPRRPIPSGRIGLRHALIAAVGLSIAALALLAWCSVAALVGGGVLLIAIVAYDLLHRFSAASIILMGLCRALTYPIAAATIVWPLPPICWVFSGALALYVTGLSLIARGEMRPRTASDAGPHRVAAALLPLITLAPAFVVHPPVLLWSLIAAVALFGWGQIATARLLATPPRIGAAVSAWIAGISLVDAVFLTLLGAPVLALVAAACWVVTVVAQRRVAGT